MANETDICDVYLDFEVPGLSFAFLSVKLGLEQSTTELPTKVHFRHNPTRFIWEEQNTEKTM